jgi:transposase
VPTARRKPNIVSFAAGRQIKGLSPEARVAARRKDIAPLVNDLIEWMKRERAKLSRQAMDCMLKRIDVFTRFLEDGRICRSNNAAERELRGHDFGRFRTVSTRARES